MSEKRKITDEELEAIIANYREELRDLHERRVANAARYENMTEDEMVAEMVGQLEEVYEHATGEKPPKHEE